MLEGVISSRTKANILVKLFLNPATTAYLRELASEFGVSTNSVRTELKNLTDHEILVCERDGRSILYRANTDHPLFPEISSIVRKITGIDELAKSVIRRLGNLKAAYVVGDYASGRDSGIIDVVLLGDIDRAQLTDVVMKAERYISRKIRPLVVTSSEFKHLQDQGVFGAVMPLWSSPPESQADSPVAYKDSQ